MTRAGRLRKDIHENLDLLGKLPTDHPNRATLEAHNGELLGLRLGAAGRDVCGPT